MAKVTQLNVSGVPHTAEEGRNPGTKYDPAPVRDVRVNRSAVERRSATMSTRRTVKKEWQAAWLVHAVKTIDLPTLSRDHPPRTATRPSPTPPPPTPQQSLH